MRWLNFVKRLARLWACKRHSTLECCCGNEGSSWGIDSMVASAMLGAATSAMGLLGTTLGAGAPLLSSSVILVSQATTGLQGRLWKGFKASFPDASLLRVYASANLS